MRTVLIVLVVLVALSVCAALFVLSGAYPIGADAPHWGMTTRVLDALRSRSIEAQARSIEVPKLDDPQRIAEGGEHYAAMCVGCHLAPGKTQSELREGLYPMPPNLSEHGVHDPAEAFWVIKHGVKMTAMPAWGKSHDDEAIWNLVAFVRQLPTMTPEQYRTLVGSGDSSGHGHHDDPEHGQEEPHDEGTPHSHGALPQPNAPAEPTQTLGHHHGT